MPILLHLLNLRVLAMLLLITITFLLKRYGTQAIPLLAPSPESASLGAAPIFARDDTSHGCQGRTVLDILWSCLATTFACTWVSVHPNVPFKGEGKWTLLRRRIFLMFFSILAPEFMIMWAFKQWRGAVMIREAVNEAIQKIPTNPQKMDPEKWTTTHGHLLQMGGLRFCATWREMGETHYARSQLIRKKFHFRHETSEGSWTAEYAMNYKITDDEMTDDDSTENEHTENERTDDELDYTIWEGVLTIYALKRLLSEKLITLPTITEDEINDKSKGDALSKGIALLQLTWFIVQIITRAVQGLAITELELTTAALAGLNSVMYIFWWSKPHDVRFPVVVRTKGVDELLAKRPLEDVRWSFSDQDFDIRKHLWASMALWIKALFVTPCYFVVSLPLQLISILKKAVQTAKTFPHRFTPFFSRVRSLLLRIRKPTTRAYEGEVLLAVDDRPPRKVENRTNRYALTMYHGAKMATKSAFVPLFCLIYIIDVVLVIPIAKILRSNFDDSISGELLDKVGGFNVDIENEIFSMMFYSEHAGVQPLLATSSIAGALFGAVHCLAWHFSFPSHVEQILWRTASLGIVGSCAVTFQAVLCWHSRGDLGLSWDYVASILAVLGLPLWFLAPFIYPVARITLLVLAITSLRSLPSSAFDTVDWVEFVPHI